MKELVVLIAEDNPVNQKVMRLLLLCEIFLRLFLLYIVPLYQQGKNRGIALIVGWPNFAANS